MSAAAQSWLRLWAITVEKVESVECGCVVFADRLQVDQYRMVGIMLLVFVRSELYDAVSDVDVQWVGTGLLGRLVRRCSVILPACF